MKCELCKKHVPKNDPHGLPWVHRVCVQREIAKEQREKSMRSDPERIIQEVGAIELSKTTEGRAILDRARRKWKKELLQPTDPEFQKEYGPMLKQREELRRENERISTELKREKGWIP